MHNKSQLENYIISKKDKKGMSLNLFKKKIKSL